MPARASLTPPPCEDTPPGSQPGRTCLSSDFWARLVRGLKGANPLSKKYSPALITVLPDGGEPSTYQIVSPTVRESLCQIREG
jgi:hypothetical protein